MCSSFSDAGSILGFHKYQPLAPKPYQDVRLGVTFSLGSARRRREFWPEDQLGERDRVQNLRRCGFRERSAQEFFQDLIFMRAAAQQWAEAVPSARIFGILTEDSWQSANSPPGIGLGQLVEERRMRSVGLPKQGMGLRRCPDLDPGVANHIVVHFELPCSGDQAVSEPCTGWPVPAGDHSVVRSAPVILAIAFNWDTTSSRTSSYSTPVLRRIGIHSS